MKDEATSPDLFHFHLKPNPNPLTRQEDEDEPPDPFAFRTKDNKFDTIKVIGVLITF